MPSAPVIVNNTPLAALWAIDLLDLLQVMYGEVLVPQAVHSEFLAAESQHRRQALGAAKWIRSVQLTDPRRADAFTGIGRGEAEVLALAQELDASLAITDDRRARRLAVRLRIPVTGTLGVLLAAKQRGVLDTIGPYAELLQSVGLYISPALLESVLQLAGERPSDPKSR